MLHLPLRSLLLTLAVCLLGEASASPEQEAVSTKPNADAALELLKTGNERFVAGKLTHPHADVERIKQAAREDQAKYAYATMLSCSDSRVPIEMLFDVGIMDVFVVRVAGNVCDTDEIGCIEYGVGHVKTPLLVILGHTGCGAVKAVVQGRHGGGHALEAHIPPLIDNIKPAVERVVKQNPDAADPELVTLSVCENVWHSIEELLRESAAVRELVKSKQLAVRGAIYHLGTGKVEWLAEDRVNSLLEAAEREAGTQDATHASGGHE